MSNGHDIARREARAEDLKTLIVSDSAIRAAADFLTMIAVMEDDSDTHPATLTETSVKAGALHERSILRERARRIYVDRVRRSKIFKRAMFGEAAWDMLLALYFNDHAARQTVTALISYSGVPSTTALRWLEYLERNEKLVTRKPNPLDGRGYWVELTDKGRELLDAYFSATPTRKAATPPL